MADSSLDDFFAKKDKSKKKSKSKPQVGDGDDVSKSEKKKKRDKDPNSTGGLQNSSGVANPREDEEWRDFEEEKEVDYTGLRIQNMQIAKEEQEREQAEADDEIVYDEDGEVRERKDATSGPWKKSNEPTPAAPVAAPVEPVVKEEAPPAVKTQGKYIPPSMRNQSQASSTVSPAFPSRRKKTAPNLQSEEDFPTLGGGPVKNSPYSSSGSSDLIENPNQRKGGNLTLENKFSALQD